MVKKTLYLFLIIFVFQLSSVLSAGAQSGTETAISLNHWIDCGNEFQLKLVSKPLVAGSASNMIADKDLKYLTVRVAIRYRGTDTWEGFEPDSFKLTELYKGQSYTEYLLDSVISGLVESDWSSPFFFSPIPPVSPEMNTPLCFEIYPEVDGWNFTFAPKMRGEDQPVCSITFRLPRAEFRDIKGAQE